MKKLKNYEVLVKALNNFSLVNLDINVLRRGENVFKKIKELEAEVKAKILYDPYLSFIEENGEPFTLSTVRNTKNWDGTLEYSTDTQNWSEWNGSKISSSSDGKLYLRGIGNSNISMSDGHTNSFLLTDEKRIQCLGNIENLLDYKTVAAGSHPVMGNYCYGSMFDECVSLTKAPDLPAITLAEGCYHGMFYGCTSLTEAPEELPATTLAYGCYSDMFCDCTSLTTAPKLPATTLADSCYSNMFESCKSLTAAPKLLATTLADYCYSDMFRNCTSLTQVSDLPATTLADDCYVGMFIECTSLTGVIHCPASIANDKNRLNADNDDIPDTATVVYDL